MDVSPCWTWVSSAPPSQSCWMCVCVCGAAWWHGPQWWFPRHDAQVDMISVSRLCWRWEGHLHTGWYPVSAPNSGYWVLHPCSHTESGNVLDVKESHSQSEMPLKIQKPSLGYSSLSHSSFWLWHFSTGLRDQGKQEGSSVADGRVSETI